MHLLLVAAMVSLPAFPLNPVAQDTINPINAHFTLGFSGPNNLASSGAEISAKYEMRMIHPLVLRAAFDYRFGKVVSKIFPAGEIHTGTFSIDALYYRGTNRLTGYLGIGGVFSLFGYHLTPGAADSLQKTQNVQNVRIKPMYGLRLTMGLRFNRNVSIEVGVTETRPKLQYFSRLGPNRYSVTTHKIRLSDVRLTVGYLWTIRGI
ncbi:MAG: hypothetical protein AB1744_01470 [Candidatus Zixiibacteriota bacterium]